MLLPQQQKRRELGKLPGQGGRARTGLGMRCEIRELLGAFAVIPGGKNNAEIYFLKNYYFFIYLFTYFL